MSADLMPQFVPGSRLIDGTDLNKLSDAIDTINGNGGTPQDGDFAALTATSVTVSADVSVGDDLAVTGSTTSGDLAVGSGGTVLTGIVVYSKTITPATVTANLSNEQTFAVTGLTTADKVIINPSAPGNATLIGAARVSGANTLAVQFTNPTGGDLTPDAGTWSIVAIRS